MSGDGGPFYPGAPYDPDSGPGYGAGLPPELNPRAGGRRHRGGEVLSGAALGGRIVAALLSLAILVGSGVAWARYRQFQSDIITVQAINKAKAPKKDIDGKDQNILITGNDDRDDRDRRRAGPAGHHSRTAAASTPTR